MTKMLPDPFLKVHQLASLTKVVESLRLPILYSIIVIFVLSETRADNTGQMFQEGLFSEYGTGDLTKAIEFYERALQSGYEDEELAAKTLLRVGICYERVGRDEDAKKAYQQIISRFPAQKGVLDEAIKRLQRLSSGLIGGGYWFRYKGEHIYLIGGGTASIYAGSGLAPESPVTHDPVRDWKAYIDLLVEHGINFVRFHPWDFLHRSEIPDYACPWVITSDKPTYDLSSFNPSYWGKLKEIISYANDKDIFFEVALFDDDSPWERHPFNRGSGGALRDRKRYHDLTNRKNREHQERYVAKTVAETAEFPNVIYEICDAIGWRGEPLTSSMKDWVSHWIDFIEERLPASSNHPITVSQHSWSSGGELDTLWNLPGIDIISVHENEGTKFALGREYTREHFLKYWRADYQKPIILNEASFGNMRAHPKGGTRGWAEERQHLWVAFASGGHAARSDFQPFADIYPSLDSCLHLANFVRQVRFWEMSPLVDFVLSCDGVCYTLGSDEEFVAYIRAEGVSSSSGAKEAKKDRKIELKLPQGDYIAKWYDPVRGDFLPDAETVRGGAINFHLPKTATDVVLYIKKSVERETQMGRE